MVVGAWPNNCACIRIVSMENPPQVAGMQESQSKAWESPGRELTKNSKKNTCNRLILKDELGESSSFFHAQISQLLQ
jgi:hypothetical protein